MPILNYTTKINAIKTIGEISQLLVERSANKIVVDYEESNPVALTFQLNHKGTPILFSLPANIEGVHRVLKNQDGVPKNNRTIEQATRTAWRILKVWIEAQVAIIDAEIVTPTQVFLPYAITKTGRTLYEDIDVENQLLIEGK